jgi:hypothetical protein
MLFISIGKRRIVPEHKSKNSEMVGSSHWRGGGEQGLGCAASKSVGSRDLQWKKRSSTLRKLGILSYSPWRRCDLRINHERRSMADL